MAVSRTTALILGTRLVCTHFNEFLILNRRIWEFGFGNKIKNEKHEIIPSALEIHSEKVKDMMVQNFSFTRFTYRPGFLTEE